MDADNFVSKMKGARVWPFIVMMTHHASLCSALTTTSAWWSAESLNRHASCALQLF